MKWTENTALAQLIIAESAEHQYTTYERLCYHLVHEHGEPDWVVVQRYKIELENLHNRAHENNQFKIVHSHGKRPVEICGYEPKP
jgi:hypothetical protein